MTRFFCANHARPRGLFTESDCRRRWTHVPAGPEAGHLFVWRPDGVAQKLVGSEP